HLRRRACQNLELSRYFGVPVCQCECLFGGHSSYTSVAYYVDLHGTIDAVLRHSPSRSPNHKRKPRYSIHRWLYVACARRRSTSNPWGASWCSFSKWQHVG